MNASARRLRKSPWGMAGAAMGIAAACAAFVLPRIGAPYADLAFFLGELSATGIAWPYVLRLGCVLRGRIAYVYMDCKRPWTAATRAAQAAYAACFCALAAAIVLPRGSLPRSWASASAAIAAAAAVACFGGPLFVVWWADKELIAATALVGVTLTELCVPAAVGWRTAAFAASCHVWLALAAVASAKREREAAERKRPEWEDDRC